MTILVLTFVTQLCPNALNWQLVKQASNIYIYSYIEFTMRKAKAIKDSSAACAQLAAGGAAYAHKTEIRSVPPSPPSTILLKFNDFM